MKKSRLGRGLNALIPQQEDADQTQNDISKLKVSLIKPNPYQPRIDFDFEALEELKQSIKEKGIKIDIPEDKYRKWAIDYGHQLKADLAELIQRESYKRATPERKMKMLEKKRSKRYRSTKRKLLKELQENK